MASASGYRSSVLTFAMRWGLADATHGQRCEEAAAADRRGRVGGGIEALDNNLLTDGVSATGLVPITLDGKSLRETWNWLDHAVHLLNVIDQRTKTVLHQRLVPGDTNEHKVALEVLPCAFAGSHRETSVFNRRCSSDGLCAFSEREFVSSSDRHRVLGHSMTDSATKLFNSQLKNRAVQSGLR